MKDTAHLQSLVNCFDDLPMMMHNLQKISKDTPLHYSDNNQSISMDAALRNYKPITVNSSDRASKAQVLAKQAEKVLQHLEVLSGPTLKNVRSVAEVARLAQGKLKEYEKRGSSLTDIYKQYDTHRSGKVRYDDFTSSLLNVNSGLRKDEADILAKSLDANKCGSIEYQNIMGALKSIEDTHSHQEKQQEPSPPLNLPAKNESKCRTTHNKMHSVGFREAKELVTVHELNSTSVSRQEQSPANKSKPDAYDDINFSYPRRRRYDSSQFHTKEAPFYVDPQRKRSNIDSSRRNRRSSSAPAVRGRLINYVSSDKKGVESNSNQSLDGENKHSLHSVVVKLTRDNEGVMKNGQTNGQAESGDDTRSPQPKRIKDEKIEQIRSYLIPTKKEPTHEHVTTTLISELGSKVDVLKNILKAHDCSKSGYVNENEFKVAIKKAGTTFSKL